MKSFRLFLLLLAATPSFAQNTHAWEFFGGYSLQRSNVREFYKSTPIIYSSRYVNENLNGWTFSVTENMNRRKVGGTLEVSGHYKTPVLQGVPSRQRIHSLMYGPRFSLKKAGGVRPFAHVLVGIAHAEVRVTPTGPHFSDFAFAAAAGGGVDVSLGRKFAVRAFEADYFRANVLNAKPNAFRASAGIVYYPGK